MVKEDVDWQHEEIDEEADAQKRGPAPQVDAVGEEELGVPPQVLLDLQVLVRVSDRHLKERPLALAKSWSVEIEGWKRMFAKVWVSWFGVSMGALC